MMSRKRMFWSNTTTPAGLVTGQGFLLFILFTAVCAWGAEKPPQPAFTRFLEVTKHPGTLVGMQYETWFTPRNVGGWETAEAIPVLGKYSSFDAAVIRKHAQWFEDLGVNWLLLDWSNMLWTKPEWEKHQGATRELEESTLALFTTYRQLEMEGKHPPKLVLMVGLRNGPSVPHAMERLNGILAWTQQKFLDNPEFKDLWLYYHGKPLLTILFFTPDPCGDSMKLAAGAPLEAADWTVRWMASQLQDNHAERCGMWSWMDGPVRQIVTSNDGEPEETVVTPASFPFPGKGWLHPEAVGREHGSPYIQSWKVAFEARPKFIQIHQWNEFAGSKDGKGLPVDYWRVFSDDATSGFSDVYADEYNLEFSDDIEPVQRDKCGYRGCGGWGYYYLNLTKAILSLYRGETPDITVMTLSSSHQRAPVTDTAIDLSWEILGKQPQSFTVLLDGKTVAENISGGKYALDLTTFHSGTHEVTLRANGAYTYFDLASQRLTSKARQRLPVTSTLRFTYEPASRK